MSLSEELKPVILANGVEDNQKVHTIAETGPLSAFTKQILLHLLTITTTTNAPYDAKCRSTIYETISSIVKYSSMVRNHRSFVYTICILNVSYFRTAMTVFVTLPLLFLND